MANFSLQCVLSLIVYVFNLIVKSDCKQNVEFGYNMILCIIFLLLILMFW